MIQFALGRINKKYPTIEDSSPMKMLIDFFNLNMQQRGIKSYVDLSNEEKNIISKEDFELYCSNEH